MATLRARIGGQWVDVTQPPPVIPEEVVAGTTAPTDPDTDLWVDTTDPAAPVLKAKDAGGAWIPLTTDEVHLGETDPYLTNPGGTWELWISPPQPYVISVCPTSHPPQASGHYQDVWTTVKVRAGGLTPGQVYVAVVTAGSASFDSADNSGNVTADANGEATWGISSGDGTATVEFHDGTAADPVFHTETKTFESVPSWGGGTAFTVGVPGMFHVPLAGPIVEGVRYRLQMTGAGMAGASADLPLVQLAGPAGVKWMITAATPGASSLLLGSVEPCGESEIFRADGTVT